MRRLPSRRFHPRMNRCHCQSLPVRIGGGSWRSGSPAAGLSQPGMPDGVLDLLALRPRAVLLQPGLSHRSPAPATPRGEPPAPAESGGPARSSRPATRLPAASCGPRDGSIFPFGRFSGTIRLWRSDRHAGCGPTAAAACPGGGNRRLVAGCAARSAAGRAASSILSHAFHDEGEPE